MGNTPSDRDDLWIGHDGDEIESGDVGGPVFTKSSKERADIDESMDEVDGDDLNDTDDIENCSYRDSLVDVGKEELTSGDNKSAKKKGKEAQLQRIVHKGKAFDVETQDVVDPSTGKVVNATCKVTIKDATLEGAINTFDANLTYDPESTKLAAFFPWLKKPPFCPMEALMMRLPILKNSTYGGAGMEELTKYLEKVRPTLLAKYEAQIVEGQISYDGLWYLFAKGNRFYVDIGKGVLVGSQAEYIRYLPSVGLCPPGFSVQGQVIKSDGGKYFREMRAFGITQYRGVVPIASLDIQPMTRQVLRVLNVRGMTFQRVALGHHYMQYEKFMVRRTTLTETYIKADGRVMVDITTFNRMNPDYTEFGSSGHDTATQAQLQQLAAAQQRLTGDYSMNNVPVASLQRLPSSLRFMTWPYVAGFSFAAKRWGEILVESLSEIQFDDQAYDRLVLSEDKKMLVKALVEDNKHAQELAKRKKERGVMKVKLGEGGEEEGEESGGASDLISGKGGGQIFLLHGSPGVGKTLTAEAIAEYLHYPLYSVSVGELGATAEALESKLNDILELAGTWNAVVLIDEADIFLEKRSNVDVLRNAMVGVFLRKLEYHHGILFLTSNRVKAFDPAFNSRINVAIRYHDLAKDSRAQVWRNLLGHLGDGEQQFDWDKLSEVEINGREIRSVIRLAQSLARSEGVKITPEHIQRTLVISQQFGKDLSEAEEW